MNLMINLELLLIIGIIIIISEIILIAIIKISKNKFQWLITSSDEKPKLSSSGLDKFIPIGYDSLLGWVRKPNTKNTELGQNGKTFWSINEYGARSNLEYENHNSLISCYGDSFTFCRQVNDDETWQVSLSKVIKSNVINFGVGNYGIDQALLRLKSEYTKHPTKIVVMGIVPDTILRIHSMWKHYSEYGNTFGFKPKFIFKKNKLELMANPINSEKNFYEYEKYLDYIQQHDFFYKNKFKKEKISFPFIISMWKNFPRNFYIIYWVLKNNYFKIGNKSSQENWKPMNFIMKTNLQYRINFFKNKNSLLLEAIIKNFLQYSEEQNFIPVLLLLPQKDDLNFIKNNYHFYKNLIDKIKKLDKIIVLDFSSKLLSKSNLDELYSDDNEYGGHFTAKTNQILASFLYDQLKSRNLINKI
mgnify:FL=1